MNNQTTSNNNSPTKPWYLRPWGIILLLFSALILSLFVMMGFIISDKIKQTKNQMANPLAGTERYDATEGQNSNWFGSSKPKITVVEFADYSCPYSKSAYPKIRQLALKYYKDLKFIYRDYPYISENSINLSAAARCAGEQGLFWPMHDKLFENAGATSTDDMIRLASKIGANQDTFSTCMSKSKFQVQIQNDMADAERFGVKGTPTWFINGYKFEGDLPQELLEKIIQELLK